MNFNVLYNHWNMVGTQQIFENGEIWKGDKDWFKKIRVPDRKLSDNLLKVEKSLLTSSWFREVNDWYPQTAKKRVKSYKNVLKKS